ncbi:TonB-dependent receptor [Flavihumibacter profundi]|uniref:TonB-dependent receptor n=1 Tax=Flavihumibacter profundi TaxID=2716883 RepID=UPI001CC5DC40|nr:TonB-dependent receptor [Flavihumibacter profundi]MBZ5858194.1 TonB-dependent receptor [Flavihumibacter profundi]
MTRSFYSLLILLLGWLSLPAQNQKNSLSGIVLDAQTGKPLAGATVMITDLKTGGVTNEAGRYHITNISEGQHLVEVSYVGFASVSEFVMVTPDAVKDFKLQPSVVENEQVVVTGISTATQARRNPTPVLVVKKQDLLRSVSTNLIDALSSKPGISQMSTGPAISKPVIRGMGYNRVIVLNDGVRQEGQQWGDEHGIEIDEQSVQKVEILKGPASLMYGSDAMAGVINILTNVPVQDGLMKGSILSNYQTNNKLRSVHLDLGGNKNGLNWNVYGSLKAAAAYRNKYDGPVFNSNFNEQNFGGYIGYNGNWGYSHLLLSNFHQQLGIIEGERNEAGQFIKLLPGGVQGLPDESDYNSIHPNIPMQEIKHFKIASDNNFQLGGNNLAVNIGYQRNQRIEFGNPDDPKEKQLYFDLQTVTYSGVYHLKEKKGWKAALGLNGLLQQNENKGIEALIPEYHMFDAGLFGYLQKRMDKFTFSGGLRFDNRHLNTTAYAENGVTKFESFSKDFSNISGSAGISYLATKSTTFKLNLSRGFRAPSIPELSSNGAHEGTNRYEYGNTQLHSETSWQADLGAEYNAEHISASASFFINSINNYIYYAKLESVLGGDSLVNGNTAFKFDQRNAALAGFELEIDIHPHPLDWLHFENTFSYVRGRFAEGIEGNRNIPFIPAAHWVAELRADLLKKEVLFSHLSLRVQLDNTFQQNNIFDVYNTETRTPGYALVNAGVSTDLMTNKKTRATIFLNVMNIGDVAYQNHLSRLKYTAENLATGRTGVYNMGRNFNIKLQIPLVAHL